MGLAVSLFEQLRLRGSTIIYLFGVANEVLGKKILVPLTHKVLNNFTIDHFFSNPSHRKVEENIPQYWYLWVYFIHFFFFTEQFF